MKTLRNKIAAITISIFFILSMTASLALIPTTSAHTPPWQITTYCYVEANPNPVGVGQTVYILVWIDNACPTADGKYGDRWTDMTVTVTAPNGAITTLGPLTSQATGGASTTFVPTVVGNYTFVGHFPQQIVNNNNPAPGYVSSFASMINDTMLASNSSPTTITVQSAAIPLTAYPTLPLPTEYWTRPINSMNRGWYVIGGNWLGEAFSGAGSSAGNYDPYTQAPSTAHILWTYPLAWGGQIGGQFGSNSLSIFATGTAYEGKFGYSTGSPVVMNGILYTTYWPGSVQNPDGMDAISLKTGQLLWNMPFETNGVQDEQQCLFCGMILNFYSDNQYGAHAYLFSRTEAFTAQNTEPESPSFSMYDAATGMYILTITGSSAAGTLVADANGNILSFTAANGLLRMWNMTQCIAAGEIKYNTISAINANEMWRPPQNATIAWAPGYQWSAPIATTLAGNPISLSITKVDYSDGVVLLTQTAPTVSGGANEGWRIDAAYSATNGTLLWGPTNRTEPAFSTEPITAAGDGVYTQMNQEALTWSTYSIYTGQLLWTAAPWTNYYDYYDRGSAIGGGYEYCWAFGGQVACYNCTTGAEIWNWNTGSSGYDTPYGIWPIYNSGLIADGMIYIGSSHEYTPPFYEGARVYCLNATTGQEMWSILDFVGSKGDSVIGDGVYVVPNTYDMQIYAFSMGPSETTVTAPNIGVTTATPVTITGTVMDTSPGSQQTAVAADFPHGLPCVSDASQSQFMEAVYEQQQMPTNLTGVPVTISVTDSNHNTYPIGTTTTDPLTGTFGLTWTPIILGNYTVTATFAGSGSYYGSYATTYFYAGAPPATPAPTAAPVTGLATMSALTYGIVAAIIVIIIIGAILAMLMLRKRP